MVAGAEWWRGAVLYQVYPRSFADGDGDGIGDLRGLLQRLPHIAGLGVDALWLCPFYASPGRDFGYDVADHRAVDPLFGTLEDFDALLRAAHAQGLRVLVDLVAGHTSDQHPWFRRSRAGREAPEADWYVWADPSPDGTPPNNWLSVFGGPAWSWEPRRRQYYLHHFLSSQPSLNLAHPGPRQALLEVAEFWLRRGVDGFRLDALDFLTHDPALRANPAKAPPGGVVPAKLFALQEHRHDMLQPETFGFLRELRALTDLYPGTAMLGEVSSQDGSYDRIRAYTGEGLLHMAYTLRPLRSGHDMALIRALVAEADGAGEAGWPCWSFSNHDVERVASRWAPGGRPDPRNSRMLAALLLSLRGSICLYQGEELGLPEAELALEEIRDPFGLAYWPDYRGRDGSRTPMPWSADIPFAGFSTAKPWLPVPPAHQALAVDAQEADPRSLLRAWRALLAFRNSQPALQRGAQRRLDLPEPLLGLERSYAGSRILGLFNLSDTPQRLDTIRFGRVRPMIGDAVGLSSKSLLLPPYGFLLAAPEQQAARQPAMQNWGE